MLKMSLSHDKLSVNHSTSIQVYILNTGPGICTSINLMLDLPPTILIVDGDPHVRIARLEANHCHKHPLKIRARQQGTFYIKSANYSYTDANLRGCHPSEPLTAALEIIAVTQDMMPAQNATRSTSEIPKGTTHTSQSASSRRKILLLTVNPFGVPTLRSDQEVRDIEEAIQRARMREQFCIVNKMAVRSIDFRRYMLDHKPNIVHFSGHGTNDGLILEDECGHPKFVTAEALAALFKLSVQVECVFLNACYSDAQADAISQHVNYVVGIRSQISDTAAIAFSTAFYDALGDGNSIEYAFDMGKLSIQMENLPGYSLPVLRIKGMKV